MSHSALLELFDEYSREILGRQEESWQAPSPEAFHQLRVYIKRMRALLGLVEELSGDGALHKRQKVFRGTFKAAGRVRDLHVQIDLVRDVESRGDCPVPWYRERLEQQEREAVESFLCRHDGMLTAGDIAAVRTAVDKALAKRSSVELSALAWRHFESCLARTIAFDVESKDLHDLRKRTKEASTLTWILERVFPDVAMDVQLKEMLDDLQNQLGKWHDFDVAVAWAEGVRPDQAPEEGRENWNRFVHELRRKRGVLRAKVMRRWSRLVELRDPAR
jgi:CHAD domain-containing protein